MLLRVVMVGLLVVQSAMAVPLEDKPPFGLGAESLQDAWRASCGFFNKKPAGQKVRDGQARFGTYGDWQELCAESAGLDAQGTVRFFNSQFDKVKMAKTGKFTAYYKPVLTGSRVKEKDTQEPLLAWPKSFASCHAIDPSPCPTRGGIRQELHRHKVLLWLDDPMDAYLLHIQGSGTVRVREKNGKESVAHVGFAGKNGHAYVAIGKVLRDWGELTGDITMPKIAAWVKANPGRRQELFESNPSYIFFKETADEAPGALGVTLTAGRSAAVDRTVVPLGTPVLIQTHLNHDNSGFNRIMFGQDVGSAIKGEARADLYLGHGQIAADFAGDQNNTGQMYWLVPKRLMPNKTVK